MKRRLRKRMAIIVSLCLGISSMAVTNNRTLAADNSNKVWLSIGGHYEEAPGTEFKPGTSLYLCIGTAVPSQKTVTLRFENKNKPDSNTIESSCDLGDAIQGWPYYQLGGSGLQLNFPGKMDGYKVTCWYGNYKTKTITIKESGEAYPSDKPYNPGEVIPSTTPTSTPANPVTPTNTPTTPPVVTPTPTPTIYPSLPPGEPTETPTPSDEPTVLPTIEPTPTVIDPATITGFYTYSKNTVTIKIHKPSYCDYGILTKRLSTSKKSTKLDSVTGDEYGNQIFKDKKVVKGKTYVYEVSFFGGNEKPVEVKVKADPSPKLKTYKVKKKKKNAYITYAYDHVTLVELYYKKGSKWKKIGTVKKKKKTVSIGLKNTKKTSFRIRAYQKIKNKKYYSKYSKAIKVK